MKEDKFGPRCSSLCRNARGGNLGDKIAGVCGKAQHGVTRGLAEIGVTWCPEDPDQVERGQSGLGRWLLFPCCCHIASGRSWPLEGFLASSGIYTQGLPTRAVLHLKSKPGWPLGCLLNSSCGSEPNETWGASHWIDNEAGNWSSDEGVTECVAGSMVARGSRIKAFQIPAGANKPGLRETEVLEIAGILSLQGGRFDLSCC